MLRCVIFIIVFFSCFVTRSQNLPPVAVDDEYSGITNNIISINTPEGVLINDTDPESLPLRVNPSPIINPTNGTLVLNTDGSFVYTPNVNFIGSDMFEYQMCDSGIDDLVSQFDFNTVALTDATVGPNGTSINPNAVQSGCGIRIPSGFTGGSAGLDIVVPNTAGIFGFRSFRIEFTYRDNEGTADIISGGNFRIYHITGNEIGVRVNVVNSVTGISTAYTLNLGGFGSNYNDYIIEYDEVTGDIIYSRNGVETRTEIAPDNSPLDISLAGNVTIGRFMDNAGNVNPSLCSISTTDTSKLCDTAEVALNVLRATVITNRNITYRVRGN
ncbi:Ig-like domain-containing protein [Aquimarina sp. LLG6339-5]|uniref:Ig-like domain-containing protein n=1 Tax=Aquimarina sp. LLG6339-5 TaxID=3160830 RepID=UPI00386C1BF5